MRKASTNAIVNDLILKHLLLERKLRPQKVLLLTSSSVGSYIEDVADERIIEQTEKNAKNEVVREAFTDASGKLTTQSIIDSMKLMREVDEVEHGNEKVLILSHYGGHKWALSEETFWKTLFASVGVGANSSHDDNIVIFRLSNNQLKSNATFH